MIWATVSSWSSFCWIYRASPSLAGKTIISLISGLTIWWCHRVTNTTSSSGRTLEIPVPPHASSCLPPSWWQLFLCHVAHLWVRARVLGTWSSIVISWLWVQGAWVAPLSKETTYPASHVRLKHPWDTFLGRNVFSLFQEGSIEYHKPGKTQFRLLPISGLNLLVAELGEAIRMCLLYT